MVNWFRTVLLNQRAAATPGPAEEYVPPDYVPITLPDTLTAARTALFGVSPDRAGINVTLSRILGFLSVTKYSDAPLYYDARVTYDPTTPLPAWWTQIGATVTTLSGSAPEGWSGSPTFYVTGRSRGEWIVTTDGAGNYSVSSDTDGNATGSVGIVTTGDAIPLPGSTLRLVVPTNATGTWSVSLLTSPTHSWVDAANFSGGGIFNPSASSREAAWFADWSDAGLPAPLRAAVLALAVAERSYELVLARES